MANEIGPNLDDLRRELEALGMVVVPFGDEIHVRRSTLEYVKVRLDNGVLRSESRIGAMTQVKATWVLLAAEMVVMLTLATRPPTEAQGLVAVFAGLLAFGFHALRYTLAEATIGRIEAVWLDLRARYRAAPAMLPPSPERPALPEGSAAPDELRARETNWARKSR